MTIRTPGPQSEVLRAHRRVIAAIAEGEAEAAEVTMRRHIVAQFYVGNDSPDHRGTRADARCERAAPHLKPDSPGLDHRRLVIS